MLVPRQGGGFCTNGWGILRRAVVAKNLHFCIFLRDFVVIFNRVRLSDKFTPLIAPGTQKALHQRQAVLCLHRFARFAPI
jgi:hypothetical protein